MARHFVAASGQYLTRAGAVVTAPPLTFSCWCKPTTLAGGPYGLVSLDDGTDGSGASNAFYFLRSGPTTGPAALIAGTNTLLSLVQTSGGATAGVWAHFAAVVANDSSHVAYLNGVASAVETTYAPATGLTTTNIGRVWIATQFANGDIAEVGIWNAALSGADIAQLASGLSADQVRGANLVAYYQLQGTVAPEPDSKGGTAMTVIGATPAAHPPIDYGGSIAATRAGMFEVF